MSVHRAKRTSSSSQPADGHPERTRRTKALVNESQLCIDKSHRARDRGARLIETSQALRIKSTVCPVCHDHRVTPVKHAPAVAGKIKLRNMPRAVMGYRCSNGHVFFAGKKGKQSSKS